MKKTMFLLFAILAIGKSFSQTETFDITTYTPPSGWSKNFKENAVTWSTVNQTKGTFCVLAIYAAHASIGSPQKDFTSEWKSLVSGSYQTEANPKTEIQTSPEGWKAVIGGAKAKQDNNSFYAILSVYSGFGKTVSILITFNDQSYMGEVDTVVNHIKLDKKAVLAKTNPIQPNIPTTGNNTSSSSIVGVWSNQAVAIANYVTSSGAFVGSADVNTMEEYSFNTGNTYIYKFFGMSNGKLYYTETSGTFKINGRNLMLTPLTRKGGYSGAIHNESNWLDKPETIDCYIGPNKWEAGPFLNLHKNGNYYLYPDYPYDYYRRIQ